MESHHCQEVQDDEDETANSHAKLFVVDTLPRSIGLCISQLWEDPGVQQTYGLSHQFQLNETAR